MLHIQQAGSVTARWGVRGWPPLADWAEHPDIPPLYWALHEIGPAADADDLDAVDDLLAETALWLDRILLRPPAGEPVGHPDLIPVLTLLWGEMQLGRGTGDLLQLKVNAALACKATAPAVSTARPATAVPRYVAGPDRVRGGHLPLVVGAPTDTGAHPEHELFLLQLAAVLSNGRGHLSDFVAHRAPPGSLPERTGWTTAHQGPAGPLLGSIRSSPDDLSTVLLRPQACVHAIQSGGGLPEAGRLSPRRIGRALAAVWLIDTTLAVGDRVERRTYISTPVMVDADPEAVWRLPLAVFHPDQFGRLRPDPRAGLRVVPDQL